MRPGPPPTLSRGGRGRLAMRSLAASRSGLASAHAPAPRHPGGHPEDRRAAGRLAFRRGGRRARRRCARPRPTRPRSRYLDGYNRFMRGDYDGAGARAGDRRADRRTPAPTSSCCADLAKEARDAIKDHKEERSAHVVIRYPAEDAVLVPYARDTLEAAYQALHDDLGFDAELPIRVEFYRSPSDLAAVSSLSQAEVARTGTIALCKWARLMVTTPRALAYGYPWLDSINHELVHYAVSTLTHDRAPVWLQEGLAKFLERRWREPAGGRIPPAMEHLLAKALHSGKLISFDAMHPSMAKLPSAEDATLAFAEVANAIAYLHEQGRHGRAARRDQARRRRATTRAPRSPPRRAARGRSSNAAGARSWPRSTTRPSRPSTSRPPTSASRARSRRAASRPRRTRCRTRSRRSAPFRHLRLGNMLLRRDRPRAAVAEYEKGAKAIATGGRATRGDPSAAWVFPVKLGRTYLALGEPDRALKALAPVQAIYPDLPVAQPDRGRGADRQGEPRRGAGPAAGGAGHQPVRSRAFTARWRMPTASCPRPNALPPRPCRASRGSAGASRANKLTRHGAVAQPSSEHAGGPRRLRETVMWPNMRAGQKVDERSWLGYLGCGQIGDLVHGDPPTREVSDESDQEADHDVVVCSRSGARDDGASSGHAAAFGTTPAFATARRAPLEQLERRRRPGHRRDHPAERRRQRLPGRQRRLRHGGVPHRGHAGIHERPAPGGDGDRNNIWLFGAGGWYHLHRGASSDLSVGRCRRHQLRVQRRPVPEHADGDRTRHHTPGPSSRPTSRSSSGAAWRFVLGNDDGAQFAFGGAAAPGRRLHVLPPVGTASRRLQTYIPQSTLGSGPRPVPSLFFVGRQPRKARCLALGDCCS